MTFDDVKARFLAAWDAGGVRFNIEHIEDKLEITGLVYADIRAVVASSAKGARDQREARTGGDEKWEFFGFPNTRHGETTVVADFKANGTILVTLHYTEELED